jgi:outer membrane scaffolding protein for murein synthesis (MipA/OmpV family)
LAIKFVDNLLAKSVLTSSLAVTASAFAGQEVTEISIDDWPTGSAGLGGALHVRRNLYQGVGDVSDWQAELIPLLLYNGKYVFARGTAFGVHVLDKPALELNLLARIGFEFLEPGDNAFYEGIEPRKQTLEGGAEMRVRGHWGEFQAAWLTDTLDRHRGQSAELSYRYDFDYGRLTVSPFVSWEWRDSDMTNYYYGVSADEARPGRPEYAPGDSQWISFGLRTTYAMTERALFFGNIGFGSVDPAVEKSPIVGANNTTTLYMGGSYAFGNLIEPEIYRSPARESEWSWRVNYGYAAEGNIFGDIDQGDFSENQFADPSVGGITVGKLLREGPRTDSFARFALFRHFESDYDNGNFNSYALYLMVMGKGFEGWSREEWFRWGVGFGLSFAEKVPIAERLEQEDADENTSRLLAYLEMQLDFPLRRLFKAKSVRNCYVGVTTVHRSGIFGMSDVLGDVSGGSDSITAHLECRRN